jgi:hypothetical protein
MKTPEKVMLRNKLWRINNPEQSKRICNNYNRKPTTRFKNYKNNAKRRCYSFDLSFDEFMKFWQQPCWYCGNEIKTIGIDRIDSKIGYIHGNIISCCISCNWAKNTMTLKEFLVLSNRIAALHPEESERKCDGQRVIRELPLIKDLGIL